MARLPRLAVGGLPHLVLQRGHNLASVAADEVDGHRWLEALRHAAQEHRVAVHAYALWTRGFVLLVTPADASALGRMMQSLGRRYGAHFNRRHGRTGGLWEGRFRATVIDPARHVLDAMHWIEAPGGVDPLGAARRADAADGTGPDGPGGPLGSSAAHHRGERRDPIVTEPEAFWTLGNTPFEREMAWRSRLGQPVPPAVAALLYQAVDKGWALGSPQFVAALKQLTPRRLEPLPRGRPRKTGTPAAGTTASGTPAAETLAPNAAAGAAGATGSK